MAGAQFVVLALRFFRCIASDSLELRGTARLLSTVLARRLVASRRAARARRGRAAAAAATGLARCTGRLARGASRCVVALAATSIVGRYLFFVSVVPKHLAAPYIASASEAA